MKLRFFFAAAAGAIVLAAPSAAKPTKVEIAAQEFYACAVDKRPADASAFVLADPNKADGRGKLRFLYETNCFKPASDLDLSSLGYNRDVARHGLAEFLVRRDLRGLVPAGIAAIPPLSHSSETFDEARFKLGSRYKKYGPRALTEAKAQVASYQFLSRFGECVVRRNPNAALRLILSSAGSNEESMAMAGVRPQLGLCIGEGQKLGMNLPMLRGSLAYNLYRLANAAKSAAPTVTERR